MSLEERFEKAVWLIRNGPKRDSDNDTKLKFYSFYKQARADASLIRDATQRFEADENTAVCDHAVIDVMLG